MSSTDTQRLRLTIALSARWDAYPLRFHQLAAHGFALEYTPSPDALEALPTHVGAFVEAGIPVRYHAFFPEHEFGHRDVDIAEASLRLQMALLEAMQGLGEQVVTVHIGLLPATPLDLGRAQANLARLAERSRELGITLCLENLRRGPTSDPKTVHTWAQQADTMITLDVGHAISCQAVRRGERSVKDYIATFSERLFEVHMYEREEDRHYPPKDMTILGPVIERLFQTRCSWWTLELPALYEALATRALLLAYMEGKR